MTLILTLLAVMVVGAVVFLIALVRRFGRKSFWFLGAIGLGVVLYVTGVEAVSRAKVSMYPAYTVLFLEPDPVLGWKGVPNFEFTWTDSHWYAREFSVPIKTNSLGFCDLERTPEKPAGTTRVVLLGDSMVEALQVPPERTAAALLQDQLNESGGRHEVLNFGVSNYGPGQCLLNWEQNADKFHGDTVFLFVADFLMQRTVTDGEYGVLTHGLQLRVRPTFSVEKGELIRKAPADYDRFVQVQDALIQNEFGGSRIKQNIHYPSRPYREFLFKLERERENARNPRRKHGEFEVDAATREVNEKVFEELHRQIKAKGGQLVLVDACCYFHRPTHSAEKLRYFCKEKGIGYVNLSDRLIESQDGGRPVVWTYDTHFNELGNRLFAEAMFEWLRNDRSDKTAAR